jgi:uncharacterized phage protein gp47/JayE
MPFTRPPLKSLIDRSIADIHARLPGSDALLPVSNLNVLAHVNAAAVHGLYGFLDWLSKQVMPDTADDDYLARWASIWKVNRRPAAPATGVVTLSGIPGASVLAGTQLSSAHGERYNLLEDVTLVAETAIARVEAVTPGAAGNLAIGALTLVSPVPGIKSTAIVAMDGLTGGTDAESDASLRERLMYRIQRPPRGGAAHDYEAWAKEVPGVTRVWVAPETPEPGYVTVRFVRDDDENFIPSADEIGRVQTHIDQVRPVQAHVHVLAPVPVPIDFEIDAIPASQSVREAIEAEIRDLLLREAAPGAVILKSHITEAISIALGEMDHTLVSPTSNVVFAPSEIAVFGGITWV